MRRLWRAVQKLTGHRPQLDATRVDWDQRARENARHYVDTSRKEWTDAEFFASGRESIAGQILTDTINIYQGRDPKTMRVLEIGCGAGRLTLPLAELFGEVHAVDFSGEMVARARQALSNHANAHIYQNNGCDLNAVPPLEFDFAFSTIVFQHIPSYEVIESYVREVHRLLRPGALFKFQLEGGTALNRVSEADSWHGVAFSEQQARDMAERCGFEMRYAHGAGEQEFWLWFFKPEKPVTLSEQLETMRLDWDRRARENARHYVENSREQWSDADFFENGRQTIAEFILTDTVNIFQGKDPKAMRVLEIGCGAGRLTRPLAELFGEVHAVDVSGEMVEQARRALAGHPNAQVYWNNGCDLTVVPPLEFDFAFSMVVFQHIPSYQVIESYVREVHRLLRPGAVFKFQVQGCTQIDPSAPHNTWEGVAFSEQQAREMAERCGFEMRYSNEAGEQYFFLWFFKPETDSVPSPAQS